MSDLTTFAKTTILDHVLGTTPWTKPTVYVALLNNSLVEISGGGYVRKAITYNAASGGYKDLASNVEFTASGNWLFIQYIALYDALSGGNQLAIYNAWPSNKTVRSGDKIIVTNSVAECTSV